VLVREIGILIDRPIGKPSRHNRASATTWESSNSTWASKAWFLVNGRARKRNFEKLHGRVGLRRCASKILQEIRGRMTSRSAVACGVVALAVGLALFTAHGARPGPCSRGVRQALWRSQKVVACGLQRTCRPEQYGFRPHPESMSFGELLAHIATTNYQFCAGLKDSEAPALPSPIDKAARVKFLSDSFDYCSVVIRTLLRSNSTNRTTLPTDVSPGEKSCSRCTFMWLIIAARPKTIFGTRASGRLPTWFLKRRQLRGGNGWRM